MTQGVPVGGVGLTAADRLANIEAILYANSPAPNVATPFAPALLAGLAPNLEILTGATDAILIKSGQVKLSRVGAVDAATLALPKAGSAANGGDDGKILVISVGTAFAHTVTTPANGIDGASHIITFTNTVGDFIILQAFNGSWITGARIGAAIS